jgi:hypothetical protein
MLWFKRKVKGRSKSGIVMGNNEPNLEEVMEVLKGERLTTKQRRFIEEYVKVPNGAEAARRAGYSPRCVHQQAYENLRNPKIRKIIDRALAAWMRALLQRV